MPKKANNYITISYKVHLISVSKSKYHQESDVMISNEIVVQDGDNSNTDYYFSFKRRVAFAKMTLKGLNPNDKVSKVKIESDKAIAGTYNSETDSFDSNSSNSIVLNDILEKIDENGTATIYFAVVPVEDANLTVTVETVTEEAAAANTYRKTFARPISFVTGDVRAFGVAMTKLVDSEGGWVKTDISAISASDIVVIVGSNYGIRNDEGTSTSPDVVSVTISNNKITSVVPNNIKWNISGNSTDGYVFYPNGNSDKWLYCKTTKSSKNNDNIRVGTGDRKQWKPDVNGYYVNTVGGTTTYVQRVLSIYNNSDWRSYNNTDNNPQKLEFYVLQSAGSSEGGGEPGGEEPGGEEPGGGEPGGEEPGNSFNKLTSSLTDYSGEYLMLHSNDYVVSGVSSNHLSAVSLNPTVGDQILVSSVPESAAVLTIAESTTSGYYTIKLPNGNYLGWSSSTDFSIYTTANTDNCLWSISITNSSATIKNKNDNNRIIKWYASKKEFRPYTTQSYDLPVLYKKN